MAHQPRGTLVDYLIGAIVPALIMVMVASLMMFMLDVGYRGEFHDRLAWILFWFVFGIVLITRVSMQIGSSLAMGYGIALGGAVALVASTLAGFMPLLLVILGVVWWVTHKLTFDCTLVEEDQDAGVGLLQDGGLERTDLAQPDPVEPAADRDGESDDPDAMDTSLAPDRPWWKKLGEVDSNEPARRPHAPGVWLIYFTLASLPFFACASRFVPAVEEERRAWLFIYFLAYLSSGMGLLLATSFLNLRRYLRKRKLKMPRAMTATWLMTGTLMIAGLTIFAAVAPIPGTGIGTLRGSTNTSSNRQASNNAVLRDSGVKGEGAQSEGKAEAKSKNGSGARGKSKGSGKGNDPNASQEVGGKGKPGGKSGPGTSKSGAPKGKPTKSDSGAPGKKGAPKQDQSDDTSKDPAKKNDDTRQEPDQEKADKADEKKQSDQSKNDDQEKNDENQNDSSEPPSTPPPELPSLPFQPPAWLLTLLRVAIVIGVIFVLIRYGAAIFDALRQFLASLFGGLFIEKHEKGPKDPEAATGPVPPPQPFSAYANPFETGLAERLSPDELVVYSFQALEAWAFEHDLARLPQETPTEFVHRLGEARGELRTDAARLVGYFVTIVYGHRGFRAEVLPPLRQFWAVLRA
jgi:chromate transport protein ChrA